MSVPTPRRLRHFRLLLAPLAFAPFWSDVHGTGQVARVGQTVDAIAAPSMVEDGCRLGLSIGDTLRFIGVQRTAAPSPIGALRVWSGSADQISYAETWRIDTTTIDWEGSIKVDENGKPISKP